MTSQIRMYSLSLMSKAAQKGKAPLQFPCVKLKGSKGCSFFQIGYYKFFFFFDLEIKRNKLK